jgi:Tfp pilus assembly protein PilF
VAIRHVESFSDPVPLSPLLSARIRQNAVGRARELFREGAALNSRDAAILQAWARLEAAQGQTVTARALFDRAARVDPKHQPVWQAWGVMEYRSGNTDTARALFQRGVWANPKSTDAARLFQAWGVLEDRQVNTGVARELFKCAVKADPSSVPSWQAWAQMEERLGAVTRAAELRGLCLQERADESVGRQDLSPAGLESMLRPVLDKARSRCDEASPFLGLEHD